MLSFHQNSLHYLASSKMKSMIGSVPSSEMKVKMIDELSAATKEILMGGP